MLYYNFSVMKRIILSLLIFLTSFPVVSQPFMFVFLNKKADKAELPKEQVDKLMEGHMANINRLAKEGKLIAAGPFDGGGGIFIFRSQSKSEVEGWLSTDPGVQAKRWDVEIFPYQPRTGSVCAVQEPYEMTEYHFIRYGINMTKYTVAQLPAELQEHDVYIKKIVDTGNVIAEGSLGRDEGNILIMKGDLQKELIDSEPAIQKEYLEFDLKKLFIARGSFCEPK